MSFWIKLDADISDGFVRGMQEFPKIFAMPNQMGAIISLGRVRLEFGRKMFQLGGVEGGEEFP